MQKRRCNLNLSFFNRYRLGYMQKCMLLLSFIWVSSTKLINGVFYKRKSKIHIFRVSLIPNKKTVFVLPNVHEEYT